MRVLFNTVQDSRCLARYALFAINVLRMRIMYVALSGPTHHVLAIRFSKMKIFAACILASVLCALGCLALDNGLGLTPQMGWNSWNHFNRNINQTIMQDTADAFIKYGLDKLGYVYVNVDDCWASSRDSNKVIVPDPKRFQTFKA